MYQYEDPPEVQSPEQRSVVFASLANLLTFFTLAGLCGGWVEHHFQGWIEFYLDVGVPIVVSVLVMYMGCLWANWPRLLRVVMLSLLSGLMLVAMLVYLFILMIAGVFYYSMFQQQGGC